MKSNKKELIFLGLVVFSGQIVQAKPLKEIKDSESKREQMLPVSSAGGLALPRFSDAAQVKDISSLGFVSIATPKQFKNSEELKTARLEYKRLTRLKDVKGMAHETVLLAYNKALELGYYEDAIFYLKHLMKITEDKKELQKFACQMADLHFALGNYTKAAEAYLAYLDMYPGATDNENALFHYIFALNTQRPSHDQDQEITHQVIRYAEKYMLEPSYTAFAPQVKSIHRNCYAMLYDSEKSILDFYIKGKKPVAAEGRYAYLKQKYYEDFPEKRSEILAYGCDVAQLQGNQKLYNERLAFLDKQFPSYRVAYQKKSFGNLF